MGKFDNSKSSGRHCKSNPYEYEWFDVLYSQACMCVGQCLNANKKTKLNHI